MLIEIDSTMKIADKRARYKREVLLALPIRRNREIAGELAISCRASLHRAVYGTPQALSAAKCANYEAWRKCPCIFAVFALSADSVKGIFKCKYHTPMRISLFDRDENKVDTMLVTRSELLYLIHQIIHLATISTAKRRKLSCLVPKRLINTPMA